MIGSTHNRISLKQRCSVCRALAIVGLFALRLDAVCGQTLWGLQPGDAFRVETTVESVTRIGETTAALKQTQVDRYVTMYRIDGQQNGRMLISARILEATTGTQSAEQQQQRVAESISRVPIEIEVDRDGHVTVIDGVEQLYVLAGTSEGNAATRLPAIVSPAAVESWVAAPFLLVPGTIPDVDVEGADEAVEWERMFEISLGPFGQVRSTLLMNVEPPLTGERQVNVKVNGRHVPIVVGTDADRKGRMQIAAEDVQVTDTAASAVLKISEAGDSDTEEQRRPWLETFTLEMQISGVAVFKANEFDQRIPFSISREQSVRLLDYTSRRASLPQIDLPPPADQR